MVSIPSSELLSKQLFAPWNSNQPNGGTTENCVGMYRTGQWNDWPCFSYKFCVACQIPTIPVFVMKGNNYRIVFHHIFFQNV